MVKILLIEDDNRIREIISTYFKKNNIDMIEAIDGYDGLSKMNESINLVLLDIMMQGIDGLEVCFQLRQKYSCPIVFISALSEEETQLKAYELGGDDYVSKPFLPSVLYAKCMALCKRSTLINDNVKEFGHLKIDFLSHQVWIDQEPITLTNKEYLLLEYLVSNYNVLLSREQIIDVVWGYEFYGESRVVDTSVKNLRKKLGKYNYYIQTVIKGGYRFKVGEDYEKDA